MASNRAVTHYITQQGNPIIKNNLPPKLLRSMSLNEWKRLLEYHGSKCCWLGLCPVYNDDWDFVDHTPIPDHQLRLCTWPEYAW